MNHLLSFTNLQNGDYKIKTLCAHAPMPKVVSITGKSVAIKTRIRGVCKQFIEKENMHFCLLIFQAIYYSTNSAKTFTSSF